jgi:hypothetical protein
MTDVNFAGTSGIKVNADSVYWSIRKTCVTHSSKIKFALLLYERRGPRPTSLLQWDSIHSIDTLSPPRLKKRARLTILVTRSPRSIYLTAYRISLRKVGESSPEAN